jgi:putative transcriptional regulator
VIKYNLKILIYEKEFAEDRKITYKEISEATGISRQTLSKIASRKGYKTSSRNIEKLCKYFNVTPDVLMTIVPDPQDPTKKSKSKS